MTADDRFAPYSTAGGTPAAPDAAVTRGPATADGGFFAGPPSGAGVAPSTTFAPPGALAPSAPSHHLQGHPAQVPTPGPPRGWPATPHVRRGIPTWVVALLAVGGGLAVIGVLAAIALPVFLQQRAEGVRAATTVSIPETLPGLSRVPLAAGDDQRANEALSTLSTCGCLEAPDYAVFQEPSGPRRVVVVAAKFAHGATVSDQDAFAAGFWRGANTSPTMVFGHPESFDAGDLGGRVECGEVAAWHTRGTSCLSVDAAAMVFVLDVSNRLDVPTDTALARSVRASVEHRASP